MNTQEQRVMWLLEFAQLELGELKAWEWLKLRTELKEFLENEPGVRIEFDRPANDPATVSVKEIQEIQLVVFAALGTFSPSGAIFRRKLKTGAHAEVKISSAEAVPLRLNIDAAILKDGSLLASGSLQALLEHSLFWLLRDQKLSCRIDGCPECHRLFLRNRKQIFCSKRCINRVSRRKWLEDPDNQEKESKWAHKRYEQRVKRQKGKNVKVQRRTKTKKGRTK